MVHKGDTYSHIAVSWFLYGKTNILWFKKFVQREGLQGLELIGEKNTSNIGISIGCDGVFIYNKNSTKIQIFSISFLNNL